MSTSINIVELIEKNPITKLSGSYNNKLLTKIKERFNETEQQLFVASFYCFLNYEKKDFVIDLDDIWEWLGFSKKMEMIEIIQKNYRQNDDYIIMYHKIEENGIEESFLLNMNAFKSFCRITNNTVKTEEVNEFFKKMKLVCDSVI